MGYVQEEALQFKVLQDFFFHSVKYYQIRTLTPCFFQVFKSNNILMKNTESWKL